jgi:hypothetical protein
MPAMAGAIAAPATPLIACDTAVLRNPGANRMTIDASTTATADTTIIERLARMRSTSAPSGAVAAMPTSAPMVITSPICEGDQFSDWR